MLTLYSFGPGANSLKPMLALYEKGLEFTGRFLDPAKFEHHEDWYKAINPRGPRARKCSRRPRGKTWGRGSKCLRAPQEMVLVR